MITTLFATAVLLFSSSVHAETTIANGIVTKDFAPVVNIGIGVGNEVKGSCTGTWISKKYILTAAHCTVYRDVDMFRFSIATKMYDYVTVNGTPIKFKFHINPYLTEQQIRSITLEVSPTTAVIKHDQAIIEVLGDVPAHETYAVSGNAQNAGTPVRLVGFGMTQKYQMDLFTKVWKVDPKDPWVVGEKRTGTNTIMGYDDDTIALKGTLQLSYPLMGNDTGDAATPLSGDSGGPLLYTETVKGKERTVVLGVVSGGGPTKEGTMMAYYSSVNTTDNAAWIKSVLSK